jgi:hypothetical protein
LVSERSPARSALKSCFGIGEICIGLREKSYRSPEEETIGIWEKPILVLERTSTRILREEGIGIMKRKLSDLWRSDIGRREKGIRVWEEGESGSERNDIGPRKKKHPVNSYISVDYSQCNMRK